MSKRYKRAYSRQVALLRATTDGDPHTRAPRPRRRRHAPVNAEHGHSNADDRTLLPAEVNYPTWDPQFDAPGPAYDLLVGEVNTNSPGLESSSAALFWRGEVSRAEGLAAASHQHLHFTRRMYAEALSRCAIDPPAESSRPQRVRFTGPEEEVGAPRGKGKRRAEPEDEAAAQDMGKDRAEPMDEDEPSPDARGGDGEAWSGFGAGPSF